MYVMLLLGSIVSATVFGAMLQDFSPGRLVQVIQASAVATLVLNTLALWKQESRVPGRLQQPRSADPSFAEAWRHYAAGEHALRTLLAIGLGTLAFGGLLGFSAASAILGRGFDPARMALALRAQPLRKRRSSMALASRAQIRPPFRPVTQPKSEPPIGAPKS